MLELRSARPEDAQILSKFAERTFRETFDRDNSAEDMALYLAQAFREDKLAREIVDPAIRTVLAINDGELIGYYQLFVEQPDPSVDGPNPIHLQRLYVDARWHGKKVAHSLLQDAIDRSRNEGFSTIWLGVWEKNLRAQSFYKKWGFTEVGALLFQLGNDPQRDLVFVRSI